MDGGLQLEGSWPGRGHASTESGAVPLVSQKTTTAYSPTKIANLPSLSTTFEPSGWPLRETGSSGDELKERGDCLMAVPPADRPKKRCRLYLDPDEMPITPENAQLSGYPSRHEVRSPGSEETAHDSGTAALDICANCADTDGLMEAVVHGLKSLDIDIKRAFPIHGGMDEVHATPAETILQQGLKHSLLWTATSISSNSQRVRDSAAAHQSLPPMSYTVANLDHASPLAHLDITSAPADPVIRSKAVLDHELGEYANQPRTDSVLQDHTRRLFDTFPPLLPGNHVRKAYSYDQSSRSGHSDHHSSSGSALGSMPSPMQSHHSGRTLPSPSVFQYTQTSSAVPSTYSPTHSQSAHADHLQDLQHQISTRTLALQTLQREHDQLLAAFSRSQIRCSTLDKKSQVSDHEINSLCEEKVQLQQQVETLESQVQELIQSRDKAQHQSAADAAQWRQIMTMSSQLQLKSTDEQKRHRAERETWERDRAGLQERIEQLETGKPIIRPSGASSTSTTSVAPQEILGSASLEVLRAEIVRLRASCSETEAALRDIKVDSEQKLDQAMTAITSIREQIRGKAQPNT